MTGTPTDHTQRLQPFAWSGERFFPPEGVHGNTWWRWNSGSKYHDTNDAPFKDGFSSSQGIAGSGVTGDQTFHASAQGVFRFITGTTSTPQVTDIPGDSAGWSPSSTRAAKTNVIPVDPQEVLDGVEGMEVSTWEYTDEGGNGQGVRHIGPMAEDFHEVVEVGDSDEHINSINADGVAFAAIQGLAERLDERADRIDDLEAENKRLRERLAAMEDRLADLETGETSSASADD